jgi:hypothetical protein
MKEGNEFGPVDPSAAALRMRLRSVTSASVFPLLATVPTFPFSFAFVHLSA